MDLTNITKAFENEEHRRKAYMARVKIEWESGEGYELALVTSGLIKEALKNGAKKSDILRAIDRRFYGIVDNYLDLENNRPAHVNADDAVVVKVLSEDSREVMLHKYEIGGSVHTGNAVFARDEDGEWLPETESDLTALIDEELFINSIETLLTRKWGEA